jgi:cytoskeletal protein CcmA (bactofilin family)
MSEPCLRGEVSFNDLLRVDGSFEGKVKSDNVLIVGDTADVKGEIEVGSATINGKVDGIIKVSEKLELHSKARVKGEIHAPVVVIQEGAVFDGRFVMTKNQGTVKPGEKNKK